MQRALPGFARGACPGSTMRRFRVCNFIQNPPESALNIPVCSAGAFCPAPDEAMAVQHGRDGAFGGSRDIAGKPPDQKLADFARAPMRSARGLSHSLGGETCAILLIQGGGNRHTVAAETLSSTLG
jgi:hypothetical protein